MATVLGTTIAPERAGLPDQLAQLLQVLRHGRPRVLSRFVLEHDIALVADVTKQLDDPPEIGALLLPAG